MHGSQELRMTKNGCRRNQAFAQQALLTITIAQQGVLQTGTLGDGARQATPFFGPDDMGDDVERPRTVLAVFIVRGVGHSVIADQTQGLISTLSEASDPQAIEVADDRAPLRTQMPVDHRFINASRFIAVHQFRHGSRLTTHEGLPLILVIERVEFVPGQFRHGIPMLVHH